MENGLKITVIDTLAKICHFFGKISDHWKKPMKLSSVFPVIWWPGKRNEAKQWSPIPLIPASTKQSLIPAYFQNNQNHRDTLSLWEKKRMNEWKKGNNHRTTWILSGSYKYCISSWDFNSSFSLMEGYASAGCKQWR